MPKRKKAKLRARWNRRCLTCDGSGWQLTDKGVVKCHCRYVIDLNKPKSERKPVEVKDGKVASAGGE